MHRRGRQTGRALRGLRQIVFLSCKAARGDRPRCSVDGKVRTGRCRMRRRRGPPMRCNEPALAHAVSRQSRISLCECADVRTKACWREPGGAIAAGGGRRGVVPARAHGMTKPTGNNRICRYGCFPRHTPQFRGSRASVRGKRRSSADTQRVLAKD